MELHYSKDEKILFYIAGYADQGQDVKEINKMLTKGTNTIIKLNSTNMFSYIIKSIALLIPIVSSLLRLFSPKIETYQITHSTQYELMRVFYLTTNRVPRNTHIIGEGWTMRTWLAGM